MTNAELGKNLFSYCENDGIKHADPDGFKAIDVTSKLIKLMRKNAIKFATYIVTQLLTKGVIRGLIQSFIYFFNNSKTGGAWDIKRLKDWKPKEGDWFTFFGKKLRNDDSGNIHFGYVGSVMFPVSILRAGAGLYQIYSGTSKISYWRTFFDDPRDSKMILYGNRLFMNDIYGIIIKTFNYKKYDFYYL